MFGRKQGRFRVWKDASTWTQLHDRAEDGQNDQPAVSARMITSSGAGATDLMMA